MAQHSGALKLKVEKPPEISQEAHCKIVQAIVLIHNCANYFEGMQVLCELIGWQKDALVNEFDSLVERRCVRQQFNQWVKSLSGNT